jgi:Ran GTPase-activating protein (RanGAP) involved in mRNA processing and transport
MIKLDDTRIANAPQIQTEKEIGDSFCDDVILDDSSDQLYRLCMSQLDKCPDLYPIFEQNPCLCSVSLSFSTSFSSNEEKAEKGLGLEGAKTLSKCFSISQCLLELHLPGTNISDTILECLYPGLLHCFQLVDLDLSYNFIGDSGAKLLSALFAEEYCLTSVNLSHNHIGSFGCSHLAFSLKTALCLADLDLSVNHICDKGAMDLFSCLTSHETVEAVSLSCNRLTDRTVPFLSSLLESENTTIELIDVSGNPLAANLSPEKHDLFMQALRGRIVVDLRNCGFSNEDQEAEMTCT